MSVVELPAKTINLIKSSQVITSLTSIVKELIENSLDAKSSTICIKLSNFGFDKLEVKDNGIGIKEKDVQFVAKPHFTSKIQKFEDLDNLLSYGFRGEALSSLCAVSDVTVSTKSKNDSFGFIYTLSPNGDIKSKKPAAVTTGTSVTVQNLFKSIPVRRNYYNNSKRRKEELRKIESLVMAFAVVKPKVHFTLLHDKNLIFQKPVETETRLAIHSIFKDLTKKLVFKHFKTENLEMKLWLPETKESCCSASNPEKLFICVNERPVSHKSIEKLVKSYYSRKSDGCHGRYPIGVLLIQVPPSFVDVNLEPNKTKVFFRDEKLVLESIQKLVTEIYGEILPNVKVNASELSYEEDLDILPCTLAPPSQTPASGKESLTSEIQKSSSLLATSEKNFDLPPPFQEDGDKSECSSPVQQNIDGISPPTPPTPLDFMPSPSSQLANVHENPSLLGSDQSLSNDNVKGSVGVEDIIAKDNAPIPKLHSRKLSLSKSKVLVLGEDHANVDKGKSAAFTKHFESSIAPTTDVGDVVVSNRNLSEKVTVEVSNFDARNNAAGCTKPDFNILSTPIDKSLSFLEDSTPPESETPIPDVEKLSERRESGLNGNLIEAFPNRENLNRIEAEEILEGESPGKNRVPLNRERIIFSKKVPSIASDSVSNGIEAAVNGRMHSLGGKTLSHGVVHPSNASPTNRQDVIEKDFLTNGLNRCQEAQDRETVIFVERIEPENQELNRSFGTVNTVPQSASNHQKIDASWSRGTVMNGGKNIQTVGILQPSKFQEKNSSIVPKRKIRDEDAISLLEGRPQSHELKKLKSNPSKKMSKSPLGLSSTPRKLETAFSLFAKFTRKQLMEENPGADFTVVAQEIATRWKSVDYLTKKTFEEKANEMNNNSQSNNKAPLLLKPKNSEPSVKMHLNKSIENKVNIRSVAKLKPWHKKCLAVPFSFDHVKNKLEEKKKERGLLEVEGIVGCLKGVNGWIFRFQNNLCTLNSSRLNEVILFKTLLKSFTIPTIKMEDPVPLSILTLGPDLWNILLTLNHTPSVIKRELLITDSRIVSNGLKIVLFPGDDGGEISSGAISDIADSVPNYGLSDLREILEKLSVNSNASLKESRPQCLFNWFKVQSMRMARSSPHVTDLCLLKEKLDAWSKEEDTLPKTDARCLHGNPIFNKILSLDHL